MTVWEKTTVNLQKGYRKLTLFAATVADRAKAEINIVTLRMQIDGVKRRIGEQQQIIGRKLLEMKASGNLPRTVEVFLQDFEVSDAIEKIDKLNSDLEILLDDLQREAEVLTAEPPKQEEGPA